MFINKGSRIPPVAADRRANYLQRGRNAAKGRQAIARTAGGQQSIRDAFV